ncbi:hypothetical protein D3C87_1604920 [compost metagenome]
MRQTKLGVVQSVGDADDHCGQHVVGVARERRAFDVEVLDEAKAAKLQELCAHVHSKVVEQLAVDLSASSLERQGGVGALDVGNYCVQHVPFVRGGHVLLQ